MTALSRVTLASAGLSCDQLLNAWHILTLKRENSGEGSELGTIQRPEWPRIFSGQALKIRDCPEKFRTDAWSPYTVAFNIIDLSQQSAACTSSLKSRLGSEQIEISYRNTILTDVNSTLNDYKLFLYFLAFYNFYHAIRQHNARTNTFYFIIVFSFFVFGQYLLLQVF